MKSTDLERFNKQLDKIDMRLGFSSERVELINSKFADLKSKITSLPNELENADVRDFTQKDIKSFIEELNLIAKNLEKVDSFQETEPTFENVKQRLPSNEQRANLIVDFSLGLLSLIGLLGSTYFLTELFSNIKGLPDNFREQLFIPSVAVSGIIFVCGYLFNQSQNVFIFSKLPTIKTSPSQLFIKSTSLIVLVLISSLLIWMIFTAKIAGDFGFILIAVFLLFSMFVLGLQAKTSSFGLYFGTTSF